MDWHHYLDSREQLHLKGYYNDLPLLVGLEVRSVSLEAFGNSLSIQVYLPKLPDINNARWLEKGYNVAQMSLQFYAIKDLLIQGWNAEIIMDINITKDNNFLKFEGISNDCHICFSFEHFSLREIQGYIVTNT